MKIFFQIEREVLVVNRMFVMETEQLNHPNHLTLACSVESTETKLNYFLSGNISV